MNRLPRILLLGLMCAALSSGGCKKNPVQQLQERSETYNQNLRWQNVAGAAAHFSDKSRKNLMENLSKELDQNKIVDYGILDIALDPTKLMGSVLIEYNYYGYDQTLKKTRELQFWEYESKKKNWFLVKSQKMAPKP